MTKKEEVCEICPIYKLLSKAKEKKEKSRVYQHLKAAKREFFLAIGAFVDELLGEPAKKEKAEKIKVT